MLLLVELLLGVLGLILLFLDLVLGVLLLLLELVLVVLELRLVFHGLFLYRVENVFLINLLLLRKHRLLTRALLRGASLFDHFPKRRALDLIASMKFLL